MNMHVPLLLFLFFCIPFNKRFPSTHRPCVRDLAFVGREDELAQMTSQMSSAA